MIGEITVIPQIDGSGREIIRDAVREIEAHGLRYSVGPTGTSVEGPLDGILDAVRGIEDGLRDRGIGRATIEVRLQLEPHSETLEHQVEGIAAG
ncbi:MAG TPA: thiamine-binding protein [Gaiellaceae bacterium]|nr:thiamine-binding protein [Gaiellaceae bacterium]